MTQSSVFLGALATYRLVGRTAELQALEAVIAPSETQSFQCLVLEAKGGMGKTRLLREAYERLTLGDSLNPNRGVWAKHDAQIVALDLIDLAEVDFHPVVDFLREVRDRFEAALPNHSATFAHFDAAWLSYEEARDGYLDFATVAKRTAELGAAFEQDYTALTRDRRVVWILDTLEQLFAVPLEIAEHLDAIDIKSADLGLTTYSWLLDFISRTPQNTTLLLAGRPDPGRWVADVRGALPVGAPPPLQIADFSEDEIGLYLTYLCDQLEQLPNLMQRAQDLRQTTTKPNEIANLYRLTGGNPIRLALYIDLYFNADIFPTPFNNPQSTEDLSDDEIDDLRNQLNTDLLDYLTAHLTDPEPQVLEYLSVMRRGLDRARLKMLWGTEDDAAVDRVFARLQRLSFIKVRGDMLFLHDEFYSIYQRNLSRQNPTGQDAERERERDIFGRLIEFAEQRAQELVQEIYKVQAELAGLSKEDPAYLLAKERANALRVERRRFRCERVHYALYNNPKLGLNNSFFRIAGQAFLSNEPQLDELLQSEVTTFFFGGSQELNRQQTGVSEEDWQLLRFHVIHERVARWIRQLILKNQREKAQELAHRVCTAHRDVVIHLYPDLAPLYDQPDGTLVSDLFKHEWEACRCFAAIYAGGDQRVHLGDLQKLTALFEKRLSHEEALRTKLTEFRWRLRNILAECLQWRGYAHATLYEFQAAEQLYRQANRILEKTGFRTLQSDVQNNLARVLGERGDFYAALALCEEALKIRDINGFDLLRGLSRNTLALINNRNNEPDRAHKWATAALNLFRQINHPRGIGLALLQVAEARRRIWIRNANQIRDDPLARITIDRDLLRQVKPLLVEAEELFSNEFPSDSRLAEILIEHACLYRDWLQFFGLPEAQNEFEQAQKLYLQVMALAEQDNLRFPLHYLAASVNLAWIYARVGQHNNAEEMTAKARAIVEPAYQFSTTSPVNPKLGNVTYFRELGKLHALYALELLSDEDLEACLREYIFAVTSVQLFSPYNSSYLEMNKRQLISFVTSNFKTVEQQKQLQVLTKKIIGDYYLDQLKESLKSLQAEDVITDIVAQQGDEPVYLKD